MTLGYWRFQPVYETSGLVLLTDRQSARLPPLGEVRPQVLRDWQDQRRREQKEQAYARIRQRYDITVEPAEAVERLSSKARPDSVTAAR
jgi:hypothetical protein